MNPLNTWWINYSAYTMARVCLSYLNQTVPTYCHTQLFRTVYREREWFYFLGSTHFNTWRHNWGRSPSFVAVKSGSYSNESKVDRYYKVLRVQYFLLNNNLLKPNAKPYRKTFSLNRSYRRSKDTFRSVTWTVNALSGAVLLISTVLK